MMKFMICRSSKVNVKTNGVAVELLELLLCEVLALLLDIVGSKSLLTFVVLELSFSLTSKLAWHVTLSNTCNNAVIVIT